MTQIPLDHWLNAIGRGARRDQAAPAPSSYSIAEAPIAPGKPFEPVLLWLGGEDWRFGRWTGLEWVDEDEFIVHPLRYALLPYVPLGDGMPPVVAARPIETAKAAAGVRGEPCLLWATRLHERERPFWMIGDWNGREWANVDRELVAPLAWAPLPRAPVQRAPVQRDPAPAPESAAAVAPPLPASAAASPSDGNAPALHRRWSALVDEYGKLILDDLVARREAVAMQLDETIAALAAMPIRTSADLAVMFDLALAYATEFPAVEELRDRWSCLLALMRAVAALAPGFVFTSLRRHMGGRMELAASGIPTAAADPV